MLYLDDEAGEEKKVNFGFPWSKITLSAKNRRIQKLIFGSFA